MEEKVIEYLVHNLKDLDIIAQYLIDQKYSKVICLRGGLGAGKTTLVSAFCKLIKSDDETSSPTFSIVNEYTYPSGSIYHFDLYRLEDIEELMDIGIEDYLSQNQYCLFEWPDLVIESVLDNYILVTIEEVEDSGRKVLISKA